MTRPELGPDEAMKIVITVWKPDEDRDERLNVSVAGPENILPIELHELVLMAIADTLGTIASNTVPLARGSFETEPENGATVQ